MARRRLEEIYWIIGIIVGLIVIAGTIYTLWDNVDNGAPNGNPFDIIISPDYINEGQYDQIDFKFNVDIALNRNITSIKLAKSGVIIDRVGKNSQAVVCKNMRWEKDYNDNYVFYNEGRYGSIKNLEAEGSLYGRNNCFMVEEFPYKFTFMFTYSEDGMEEKSLTLEKEVPIIG